MGARAPFIPEISMQLLKHSQVLSMLGLSRTALHKWRRDPAKAFPVPVCESPLLWLDEDIDKFILRMRDKAEAEARSGMPELDQKVREMAGGAAAKGLRPVPKSAV
jgi:predicted DNA-binding transcriptional regulator AlpA